MPEKRYAISKSQSQQKNSQFRTPATPADSVCVGLTHIFGLPAKNGYIEVHPEDKVDDACGDEGLLNPRDISSPFKPLQDITEQHKA